MSRDDCADPGDLWEQLEQCEADAEEFCQRIAALESLVRWLIGYYGPQYVPDEHAALFESLRGSGS